jgi:hypothetical protein
MSTARPLRPRKRSSLPKPYWPVLRALPEQHYIQKSNSVQEEEPHVGLPRHEPACSPQELYALMHSYLAHVFLWKIEPCQDASQQGTGRPTSGRILGSHRLPVSEGRVQEALDARFQRLTSSKWPDTKDAIIVVYEEAGGGGGPAVVTSPRAVTRSWRRESLRSESARAGHRQRDSNGKRTSWTTAAVETVAGQGQRGRLANEQQQQQQQHDSSACAAALYLRETNICRKARYLVGGLSGFLTAYPTLCTRLDDVITDIDRIGSRADHMLSQSLWDIHQRRHHIAAAVDKTSIDHDKDFPHDIVSSRIYLGGHGAAFSHKLDKEGIECVVRVHNGEEWTTKSALNSPRVRRCDIRLADHPDGRSLLTSLVDCCHHFDVSSRALWYLVAPIDDHLEEALGTLLQCETASHPMKCLVHCGHGISRSASLVLAYLIQHHKLSLLEAWHRVFCARPWAQPNLGFVLSLYALERQVQGCDINSLGWWWMSRHYFEYLMIQEELQRLGAPH